MPRCFLLLIALFGFSSVYAKHGKGGSLLYKYLGAGSSANTSKYEITIQHFVNCERVGDEPSNAYLGIYDAGTGSLVKTVTITRTSSRQIQKTTFNSCIDQPPAVCFYLITYVTTVELSDNNGGYTLAEQECCRADGIVNISNPGSVGFTNVNTIPGIINGTVYRNNSSPDLVFKDTAVICHNSYFQIDFSAADPDGDLLTYTFCSAKASGSTSRQPDPPSAPPYSDVPYTGGYSGTSPLGSSVTINEQTGLISGTAPATTGPYIVSVCINEFRDGVQIGTTKKEVLVTVADCNLTAATLNPVYVNCDSFLVSFENESTASNIASYYWDFGVANTSGDVSTDPTPTYTYADTGTYTVKLKVTNETGCSDSTTTTVKVYPGFTPDFTITGSCYQSPFFFTDQTTAAYGMVEGWRWNFGDPATTSDTSLLQNSQYQYSVAGSVTVSLNVSSTKGCNSVVSKTVEVNDKPQITLPFTDTLICSGDRLPLLVETSGNTFSWSPLYNIENPTTANPVVYPADTTVYTVTITDKQCIDSASIRVNVLDDVTVTLPADTSMCATDTIVLQPESYALQYAWRESEGSSSLLGNSVKNPAAIPLQTTTYFVTASLGHCQDEAQETVYVAPYPSAEVSPGTRICFGSTARLQASTTAANYTWSPAESLNESNTLTPLAGPSATTNYLFTISDTSYCPKSVTDTITITVIPPVEVNAGRDTAVVINQPLQLLATVNETVGAYRWTPIDYLNTTSVANPVATITSAVDSIIYSVKATTAEGCSGSDEVTVYVYKTLPAIFIPSAFSPNGDGHNDIFKPILAGISSLDDFRVYNRWGQLLFHTTKSGDGWNGSFGGKPQPAGTYVYEARGKDYLNKEVVKKGTVVLIR